MADILIIDDEKDMLTLLQRIICEDTEHTVTTASDPVAAVAQFKSGHFDIVLTDLKMPRLNGMRVLEELKAHDPQVAVVLMTAYATIDTAVEAIQKGAFDYITKPFRRERILVIIDKFVQWQALQRENQELRQRLQDNGAFANLIAETAVMRDIFDRIRQVAPSMGTVLITGPSGTGKELVARALHQCSHRRQHQLVTINCAAIPEEIIESELFGHVKGAFTGAWKDKKGLVEEAHAGTLFLDEIGDLSPLLQTKLLRLLQEGEYKPVGSTTTRTADLRFVAATNQNLMEAVQQKKFREDLFYRLNVIHFELPPLNARRDDIPLLSYHFLEKYARLNGKPIHYIAPETLQRLREYDYAGNVRELENMIERGVIYCRGDTLTVADLALPAGGRHQMASNLSEITHLSFKDAREAILQQFHRRYIESLLRDTHGNISRAAETAGIQRQYLHRLIREAGIVAEDFKS